MKKLLLLSAIIATLLLTSCATSYGTGCRGNERMLTAGAGHTRYIHKTY